MAFYGFKMRVLGPIIKTSKFKEFKPQGLGQNSKFMLQKFSQDEKSKKPKKGGV